MGPSSLSVCEDSLYIIHERERERERERISRQNLGQELQLGVGVDRKIILN